MAPGGCRTRSVRCPSILITEVVILQAHDNYERVASAARHSHANGRSVAGIGEVEIALARLYCHAFRGHVIGAFHATRVALEGFAPFPAAEPWRQLANHGLTSLANQALDPVPRDFRAVLSTFHRYDTTIGQVLQTLRGELDASRDERIELVLDRFLHAMQRIALSNGIAPARDDEVPEQASFVVPNLGITIVPLVYGDRHCWNLAYLSGQSPDVPRHLHAEGVEIHLGYGKLRGFTVLGDCRAEVAEGYAMSIPAGTPHGFINTSGHDHFLPFIFGSSRLGGWGIVLDVAPRPVDMTQLPAVPADSAQMNGLVLLDREIDRMAALARNERRVLIDPCFVEKRASTVVQAARLQVSERAGEPPAPRTCKSAEDFNGAIDHRDHPSSGDLALAVARSTPAGLAYPPGPFRIVSIARGRGTIRIGDLECEVQAHDHVGIPAEMTATLRQQGDQPLVALDALLLPHEPVISTP